MVIEEILKDCKNNWSTEEIGKIRNALLVYLNGLKNRDFRIMEYAAIILINVPMKKEFEDELSNHS
jgi:hypothetical protein